MAANIQEALELGCRGFLFDEDTCATNFLIRDMRMQMLVSKENEPITPLISKVIWLVGLHAELTLAKLILLLSDSIIVQGTRVLVHSSCGRMW